MIDYRTMTMHDIDAGLALCRSAGWNQLENDWKLFLELNPGGSRVAVDENGTIAGTVSTIVYEDHFSWIGMVLVDPEKKRQGIGTQLLLEALKILEKQETVKLDATPAGREVYLKLGFTDEYTLSRMISRNDNKLQNQSNAHNTTAKELHKILQTDREVFGASRKELLMRLHKNSPELSFSTNNSYSFGRNGYNFTQIGPVIADNPDDAKDLITGVLSNSEGPMVIDVMDSSPIKQWLISLGFTEQRKLIRMYRGKNVWPGIPAKQFAILGPEFG